MANNILECPADEMLEIIGKSDAIVNLKKQINLLASSDYPVFIEGETGTGKELVAKAIHRLSKRKNNPIVEFNCGAITQSLAISELFGYVKGAFTGAIGEKVGIFEQANTGTLFLDEIGELLLEVQTALLRLLEGKSFSRIGGKKIIEIDTRIITATNKDLKLAINDGIFREDLYYRLNILPIKIPPLRERSIDIPLLVNHFLENEFLETDKKISLSGQVKKDIEAYSWPGNIRELLNVIKHLVATTINDTEVNRKQFKLLRPEIYNKELLNKSKVYIKYSNGNEDGLIDSEENKATKNLEFTFENFKEIYKFVEVLNIEDSPIDFFIALFIRYYLKQNKGDKKTTAEQIGYDDLIEYGEILERFKDLINSDLYIKYSNFIPIFGVNIIKAKENFTRLSSNLQDNLEAENPELFNLKKLIELLKLNEIPLKIFMYLFVKYHLNKNNNDKNETSKKIGGTVKSLNHNIRRYMIYESKFDEYLNIIGFLPDDLEEAKEKLKSLSGDKKIFMKKNQYRNELKNKNNNNRNLDEEIIEIGEYNNEQNKPIIEFIEKLKTYEKPINAFIGLFIRYYLIKNKFDFKSTAIEIGYNPKNSKEIFNEYNIESNELDVFFELIEFNFPKNLKHAKKTLSILSKKEILINNKKEDNSVLEKNYLEFNIDLDEINNKSSKSLTDLIEKLKTYEKPIETFNGLFIRYYLIKNKFDFRATAVEIGYNLQTYKMIFNNYPIRSNEFDEFLNLIGLNFSKKIKLAKKEISKLSNGIVIINNREYKDEVIGDNAISEINK